MTIPTNNGKPIFDFTLLDLAIERDIWFHLQYVEDQYRLLRLNARRAEKMDTFNLTGNWFTESRWRVHSRPYNEKRYDGNRITVYEHDEAAMQPSQHDHRYLIGADPPRLKKSARGATFSEGPE